MKIFVKVYDKSKYDAESKKIAECTYDISKMEVVTMTDNEIYNLGFDDVDEHGEYLVLTFDNGETSTFRNSRVDVFKC